MRGLRRFGAPIVAITLVAAALVAAMGYVAWDRWWRTAGPANPGFSCPLVVPAQHRAPFTGGNVHRVALIGDSIMVQASCAIAENLADVGIETSRHAVTGSGLLAGFDWIAETQKILRTEHPDVVIAIFVGNFLAFGSQPDPSVAKINDDTPQFFRAWQARARLLSAEVHAAHARLYWVSPPPISEPPLRHAARLFAGYRTIPGDHFLMSGRVLAGSGGGVVMTKETCGRTQTIRTPDRVHLTDNGARIYGEQIAHDFTARLGILTTPRPC